MDSNKQRTDVKGSQVYFGKLVTPFKFTIIVFTINIFTL